MGRLHDLIESALGKAADSDATKSWQELTAALRTYVRVHMGRRAEAEAESMDVVNSMLESFLADVRSEKLKFESEANLEAYLRRMTARKVSDLLRRARAAKRGGGRDEVSVGPGTAEFEPAAKDPHASMLVREQDLRAEIRRISGPEDDRLFELYENGLSWSEIGIELGITPEAARKRLTRLRAILQSKLGAG